MTRQQAERLASEMKKHRGEWVLVKDSRIVAHAATVKEAKSALRDEDRAHVTALFCPSKDFSDTTFTALWVRFEYSHLPLPGNVVEPRPMVDVVFDDDTDETMYPALVDSGSLRTIVSRSAIDLDLGEPDGYLETLRFAGYVMHNVPFYPLSMRIKSPHLVWDDISLPDVPVAVVDSELPFVLLGSAALTHLIFLLHEHDQVFHMKPREYFTQAEHYGDPLFWTSDRLHP